LQRTTVPLLCDLDSKNRTTGAFIPIDEANGITIGAGTINSGVGPIAIPPTNRPSVHTTITNARQNPTEVSRLSDCSHVATGSVWAAHPPINIGKC
jgi:sulfate adenylyltransferase subunit 1 (EFTu-like GTPase family)